MLSVQDCKVTVCDVLFMLPIYIYSRKVIDKLQFILILINIPMDKNKLLLE